MLNIYIDENINLLYESLSNFSNAIKFSGRKLKNQDLINDNCDILFTRSQTKINKELLENTSIKLVATATAGTDHVDLEYLKSRNIPFFSAAGSNANSVAEFVVYSIMSWSLNNNYNLKSKKIGIIGFGNIGKIVADYSHKIGLEILVNDPPLRDANFVFPGFVTYSNLDDLINECDIITNHVPLTMTGDYKTIYLLNSNNLKNVKNNSLFIHFSRGKVVDENSMIDLISNKNCTLAIDVWSDEPDFNNELAEMAQITTPHIAGYSYDGKLKGAKMMLKVFEDFTGIKPDYSIIDSELMKRNYPEENLFNNHRELFDYIELNRNFKNDIIDFKNIVNLDKNKQSKEFDNLRKNYPKRRECL